MKLDPAKVSLLALQMYLEGYELPDVVKNASHKRRLKTIYRHYHALLTWHAYFQENKPTEFKGEKEFQIFLLYLSECVSDICQAIFLWSHGLYKPCNLILRSSIENFFRSIGLQEGQAILEIESTFELARVIRATNIVQGSPAARVQFDRLWSVYGELCKYVHTADRSYMSLTTAVGVFPRFDQEEARETSEMMRKCITANYGLLCLMFPKYYRKFHHGDYDAVSDVLPKAVRQKLGGR